MTDTRSPSRALAEARRLLVGVTTVVLVATASGVLVGRAVWEGRPREDLNDFSDLGYGIGAALLGLVVAGSVHLVGLVAAVRWALPRGRRLAMAFAVVAAEAMSAVALSSLARAAGRGGMATVGIVVAVVLVVAAVAGIGVLMEAVRPATAGWIGMVAGAGFVFVFLVGGLRADSVAAAERVDRYAATGAPLALVDGRDMAVPVDGWDLAYVDGGWSAHRVTATFDVASAGAAVPDVSDVPTVPEQVRLDMDSAPDPRRCEREPNNGDTVCVALGPFAAADRGTGGEIRGETVVDDDGTTELVAAWVDVPGGRWTVWGSDLDDADAVAVLRSLDPVDAATFAAAT